MKCLLTKQETLDKASGFPVSREGRSVLNEALEAHNSRIADAFIEANSDKGVTEDYLKKLSPKVTKRYFLSLLDKGEPDALETVAKVNGTAENAA